MKYKVSTLFSIGFVVFVASIAHAGESSKENSQQLFQQKLGKIHRSHNRLFYQGSSTRIGRGCFDGSLDIDQADFWCDRVATMARNNEEQKNMRKVADIAFGDRYSHKDIDAFVTETINREH